MYCDKCGAKIKCTDMFCAACGSKQNVQSNLITAAIDKDQLAYTTLYHQAEHSVKLTVYAIINPNGQNCTDADDIILESMLKGFSSLNQLKQPEKYVSWMQTIARNKAIDYLRKNKELSFSSLGNDDFNFEDTLVDTDESNRPDLMIDQVGKAELLKQILSELPPEQRTVLVMYFYNNLKISEIAAELGCTEATVKSRLKYGKAKVEVSVNELQSKQGIKLYSAAPMVLYWLLRDCEPSFSCGDTMLATISKSLGTSAAGGSAATSAAQAAVSQTAKSGATSAVKAGASAATKAFAIKVAAVATAGVVAVGGTAYIARDAISDVWNTITSPTPAASDVSDTPAISAISDTTDVSSAFETPVISQDISGDNTPYADILNDGTHQNAEARSGFGIFGGGQGNQLMTGLCFARVVDMDADGINELILVDGTPQADNYMVDYTMQIWTLTDGAPTKLYEGSDLYRGGDIGMQGIVLVEQNGKVYIATGYEAGDVDIALHTVSNGKYDVASTLQTDYVTATLDGASVEPDIVLSKLSALKESSVFYNFTCGEPAYDFSNTINQPSEFQALILEAKKACEK